MTIEHSAIRSFLDACRTWLCDDYFCDIHYVAEVRDGRYDLLAASISLSPLPPTQDHNLTVELQTLVAGQAQEGPTSKDQLLTLLAEATAGNLTLCGKQFTLARDDQLRVQAFAAQRDSWFSPLFIQLVGKEPSGILDRLANVDDALRAFTPPFDGLSDLTNWLALTAPQPGHLTTLTVDINPSRSPCGDGLTKGCSRLGDPDRICEAFERCCAHHQVAPDRCPAASP